MHKQNWWRIYIHFFQLHLCKQIKKEWLPECYRYMTVKAKTASGIFYEKWHEQVGKLFQFSFFFHCSLKGKYNQPCFNRNSFPHQHIFFFSHPQKWDYPQLWIGNLLFYADYISAVAVNVTQKWKPKILQH